MGIDTAYDAWAEIYDSNENPTRDLEGIAARRVLEKYTFGTVIELGCGTGKNTQWLADRAESVVGLDFSSEMLRRAREKNSSSRVTFRRADLTKAWDIMDSTVDLITCSLTLEHVQDLGFVFMEACRVLRNHGLFYVCELHPFKQYAGSRARFHDGTATVDLDVYLHHISDYLDAAESRGFGLLELKEWFDGDDRSNIPRLISLVFEKMEARSGATDEDGAGRALPS